MKKWILMCCLIAVGPVAMAQSFQKEEKSQIVNDLAVHVGRLEFDEDDPFYLSMFQEINPAVTAVTGYDLSEESYRLSETVHFGKYVAVEGMLGFFGDSEIYGQLGSQTVTMKYQAEGLDLMVMGKYPLFSGRLVVYGKGGGSFTRSEYTIDGTGSHDFNSGSVVYGAGVYSVLGRGMIVRYDYQSGKIGKVDAKNASLGLGFRF